MKYAGIGGRFLPDGMEETLIWFGKTLGSMNVALRSGAAPGADAAFEKGCDLVSGPKEIYLPWWKFDNHSSPLYEIPPEAYVVAQQMYKFSGWDDTKASTKKFMARDCMQVTGLTLDDPVDFVVCWTRDGCEHDNNRTRTTGGTGQAISYASSLGIPVFNLYNEGRENDLLQFMEHSIEL